MKKAILRHKTIRLVLYEKEGGRVILESYVKPSHQVPDFIHFTYNDFDDAVIDMLKNGFDLLSATDDTAYLRFHKLNINELV
jgi:hypothetical protein